MKVVHSHKFSAPLLLITALVIVGDSQAIAQRSRNFTVRAGEIIEVRMEDTISTRTARRGQTFQTSVLEPVNSTDGTLLIPRGAIIYGRIVAFQTPRNRGRPGTLDVTFFSIKFPNGRRVAMNGSLSSSEEDDEGQVSGSSVSRRKVLFVGSSGGAVIGAIAGGGSGAVAGGLIGATGALLGSRFTSGSHAEVSRNTEFGIYLNRNLSLPAYR